MEQKYLIINADDNGSSYGANEATEILFNTDSITSSTIMTPCQWAPDAIIRAKNNPKIKIGLHITLTSEWDNNKWGPVCQGGVDSLIADEGYFYPSVKEFSDNAKNNEVSLELEAQMKWLLKRDYEPTHVDNHMGTLYGVAGKPFLKEALEFCAKYKMPFRLPKNADNMGVLSDDIKGLLSQIDSMLKSVNVPAIDYLLFYDKEVTDKDSYETIKTNYINIIKNIKSGVSEMFMHPMIDTEDGRAGVPTWQMRNWEFLVLQDKDFKTEIANNDIKLIGWEDVWDLQGW